MQNRLLSLLAFQNSIRFRLGAVHLLLVVIILFTTALWFRGVQLVNDQIVATEYVALQQGNLYALAWLIHRYAEAEGRSEITEDIDEVIEELDTMFVVLQTGGVVEEKDGTEIIPVVPDPESLSDLQAVKVLWDEYREAVEAMLAAEPEAREALLGDLDELLEEVVDEVGEVLVGIDTYYEVAVAQTNRATLISIAGVFGLLLMALIVGSQIVRAIIRLELSVREYAAGNISARVNTDTLFELAQVGRVFNATINKVNILVRELQDQVKAAQAARSEAERSNLVKSAFLASMSHELRTPLNAIINFSKFVYNGVMGPITDEQKETLHEVIDSAEHLHNLINDVLDMSKIEAGSLKLFVEENVNISQILGSVISTGEALIREKPVRITAEIAPDLPTMRGDRQRILQIMLNIMSNACKFTDEGDITLKARHHNGMIEMSIQDTGSGIAQEDYAMVFEAFKQTETGLRQGGGTGLGLPISRSLVEAHGGKIWFESKAGYGTTFFVNLPVKSSLLTPTLSSNGASAKAGVTIA